MLRFEAKLTKYSGCYFSFVLLGLAIRAFLGDQYSVHILKRPSFYYQALLRFQCDLYSFWRLCKRGLSYEFTIVKDWIIILR